MSVCVCVCVCAGLKMVGVASQNANYFWGNCESLWPSESQYCESLLAILRIICQMVSQRPFFFSPHHCFTQNFPFFYTNFMYVIKMRLRCE